MKRLKVGMWFVVICFGLAILTVPINGNCSETKQEPYTLTCWGVNPGMTLYAYSVALSDLASKYSEWLKINVITGSIQAATWANPKRKAYQIAAGDNRQRWKYMNGKFGADKIKYDWAKNVRYLTLINFLVDGFISVDPNIKSFKDFKGKRVSFASIPNSDFDFIFEKLLEYEGMSMKDLASFDYMPAPRASSALKDGLLDVAFAGYAVTSLEPLTFGATPFSRELAETTKLNFIDLNPDAVRELSKLVPCGVAYVPPGSLKGQTKEHIGISKSLCFCVDLSVPDRVVTEIARLVYEHAHEFVKYVPVGKIMSKDTMCAIGRPEEEFHPAMWKFMQEHGIRNTSLLEGVPGGEKVLR